MRHIHILCIYFFMAQMYTDANTYSRISEKCSRLSCTLLDKRPSLCSSQFMVIFPMLAKRITSKVTLDKSY